MRPAKIKALRESLGMTQDQLAAMLGLNPGTLRNWEQGIREPTDAARALLTILQHEPAAAMRALRKGRR